MKTGLNVLGGRKFSSIGLFLAFLLGGITLLALPPAVRGVSVAWTATIDIGMQDVPGGAALDGAGTAVYVSGTVTYGFYPNPGDLFVTKSSAVDGSLTWSLVFGSVVGSPVDFARGITVREGAIYIAGSTVGTMPDGGGTKGGGDAFLVKIGDSQPPGIVWTRQFGTPGNDQAYGVAADSTGVYVVGSTTGNLGGAQFGSADAFIQKFDLDGNVIWTRQFGTSFADRAFGVTGAGALFVAGETAGTLDGATVSDLGSADEVGEIAYKSNTGSCTGAPVNCPKSLDWTGSTWGTPETVLSSIGGSVANVRVVWNPTSGSTEHFIAANTGGSINVFRCAAADSCTYESGAISSSVGADPERHFDIAYEQSSTELLLVYDCIVAGDATKDICYRMRTAGESGSWSGEMYLDHPSIASTNPLISYFQLAPNPGTSYIALGAFDTTNDDFVLGMWDGSAWLSGMHQRACSTAVTLTNGWGGVVISEDLADEFVAYCGNGASSVAEYEWSATGWEAAGATFDSNAAGADSVRIFTASPLLGTNIAMICRGDSLADDVCWKWNGLAGVGGTRGALMTLAPNDGSAGTTIDLPVGFDWDADQRGGTDGLAVYYAATPGQLSWRTYNEATDAWSTANVLASAGAHNWVQVVQTARAADAVKAHIFTSNSNSAILAYRARCSVGGSGCSIDTLGAEQTITSATVDQNYGYWGFAVQAGGQDIFVRRYDTLGNAGWTRQFGTAGTDYVPATAGGIAAGNPDSIYVAAMVPRQPSAPSPILEAVVRKYDGLGNEAWTQHLRTASQIGLAADDEGVSVAGGSLVLGGNPGTIVAPFTRRYDSSGNIVWSSGGGIQPDIGAWSSAAGWPRAGLYTVGQSFPDFQDQSTNVILRKTQMNDSPVACFTTSPEWPRVGQTVAFDASCSSDPEGDPLTYTWTFGDPGGTATGLRVSHTYTSYGPYSATLTVSDGISISAPFVKLLQRNTAPTACFSAFPERARPGETVVFDASCSSDVDGDSLTYAWTFGDPGGTATGIRASHTYPSYGPYSAWVTVSDGIASSISPPKLMQTNSLPCATFHISTLAPRVGQTVEFSADCTSDAEGDTVTYAWTFGDGMIGDGPWLTHAFQTLSSFTVRLTVADGIASAFTEQQVTVGLGAVSAVSVVVTGEFDYALTEQDFLGGLHLVVIAILRDAATGEPIPNVAAYVNINVFRPDGSIYASTLMTEFVDPWIPGFYWWRSDLLSAVTTNKGVWHARVLVSLPGLPVSVGGVAMHVDPPGDQADSPAAPWHVAVIAGVMSGVTLMAAVAWKRRFRRSRSSVRKSSPPRGDPPAPALQDSNDSGAPVRRTTRSRPRRPAE